MMAMPADMPARTDMGEPHGLQLDMGNACGDVQSGLALHDDGLQRIGIRRAADQKIAAATDADGSVGTDATVAAREIAASKPARRRIHRPGKSGLIGEAEIHAVAADGCDVWFGTAAFALKHTFETGHRADDEADILADLALQDTGAHPPQCSGACDRRHERGDRNTECPESHEFVPRMMNGMSAGTGRKRHVQNKALPKTAVKTSRVRRRSDLTIANCRRRAGWVCRRPRFRRSWLRRKCGTPARARTPSPAPPRRLRFPEAR